LITKTENELFKAIITIDSMEECKNFFYDLCTPSEIEAMEERWEVAKLLYKGGSTYRDIASQLKTSTATVTRVARFLYKESNQGYLKALKKG